MDLKDLKDLKDADRPRQMAASARCWLEETPRVTSAGTGVRCWVEAEISVLAWGVQMLDAFNRKGVRRVLVTTKMEHVKDQNENAITSMVFTPLRFMSSVDAWRCLRACFDQLFDEELKQASIADLRVELWPIGMRAPNEGGDLSRCEPDLVVDCQTVGGERIVIVGEMKWDWATEVDTLNRELDRQRQAVARDKTCKTVQFVLLKHRLHQYRDLMAPSMSWADVHRRLRDILRRPDEERWGRVPLQWAEEVCQFLVLAEQTVFTGFNSVTVPQVERSAPIFFGGPTAGLITNDYGLPVLSKSILWEG